MAVALVSLVLIFHSLYPTYNVRPIKTRHVVNNSTWTSAAASKLRRQDASKTSTTLEFGAGERSTIDPNPKKYEHQNGEFERALVAGRKPNKYLESQDAEGAYCRDYSYLKTSRRELLAMHLPSIESKEDGIRGLLLSPRPNSDAE